MGSYAEISSDIIILLKILYFLSLGFLVPRSPLGERRVCIFSIAEGMSMWPFPCDQSVDGHFNYN